MSGVDIAGLVEELRSLADCDARAGEPLGKCMRRAADALLAQAAELAEARERCQMWFDTHDAHRMACDALGKANGELMKRAMDAERRAETATRQRDEALAALKASEEALKEIARQKLPIELWAEFGSGHEADWEGGYDACVRRARSALENGPAGLADATNNPPSDPGTEQREAGV